MERGTGFSFHPRRSPAWPPGHAQKDCPRSCHERMPQAMFRHAASIVLQMRQQLARAVLAKPPPAPETAFRGLPLTRTPQVSSSLRTRLRSQSTTYEMLGDFTEAQQADYQAQFFDDDNRACFRSPTRPPPIARCPARNSSPLKRNPTPKWQMDCYAALRDLDV